jgi:NDP-sugar pyrophosphorylase family protein
MHGSETLRDIKNMFINQYGDLIVIDVSGCRLDHNKQTATLAVARLRAKIEPRQPTRVVDVKWVDGDVRSFRVPKETSAESLLNSIINQKSFAIFEKWS